MPGFGVYLCLFSVVRHHASEMPLVLGPPCDGCQHAAHWRSGHFLPCFLKPCRERHKHHLPKSWSPNLWSPLISWRRKGQLPFSWFPVLPILQSSEGHLTHWLWWPSFLTSHLWGCMGREGGGQDTVTPGWPVSHAQNLKDNHIILRIILRMLTAFSLHC